MGQITAEEAYAKHGDDLVRFATGLVGPADAADVVSTVMLRMLDPAIWLTVRSPKTYLYRAVLNEARAHHRSTLRRRARELRMMQRDVVEVPDVRPEVLEHVARLSLRQRAVVVLTYWNDLDQCAISQLLGISEGSVRRHLARAHVHLRRTLDDE